MITLPPSCWRVKMVVGYSRYSHCYPWFVMDDRYRDGSKARPNLLVMTRTAAADTSPSALLRSRCVQDLPRTVPRVQACLLSRCFRYPCTSLPSQASKVGPADKGPCCSASLPALEHLLLRAIAKGARRSSSDGSIPPSSLWGHERTRRIIGQREVPPLTRLS